ncbi:ATP-binding cassette domain-containing protein [Aquibium carbonis]|uniref:ATP-binding cassette domain-containing protein n=1 Tax=Aquibium carbonis TaxID=2495581 RepID=A0A429YHK5_9HYPH|nr:ATP-binding cassette domain-containing protein [Aquibium carbonis]RST80939.1 ATP-binding cassette domain-containing protein [Aquibium carbonis]
MLEVDIASKTYPAVGGPPLLAIEGLRFSVPDGTFACLVGPSGCGKTTCLRILLGLERDFDGRTVLPGGNPRIGVAFQEPRLLPWRTVEENVRLALPKAMRARPLHDLFARLGLDGFENFYPGALSLGLARRAALARAFAVEPGLLLLDEPFVSLDEATAQDLRALLLDVWQARPTTALMVTHNLREAAQLADRIIVLSQRPGQVRGEHLIAVDRTRRTPEAVNAICAEVSARFPGLL